MVIEHNEEFRFDFRLENDPIGNYADSQRKGSMKTDDFYDYCMAKIGGEYFTPNKNMCNFAKKKYRK